MKDMLRDSETVDLEGPITEVSMGHLENEIHGCLTRLPPKGKIVLFINSTGGEAIPALLTYEYLQGMSVPIIGVVGKEASSMALTVFAGCTERYMHTNAYALVHKLRPRREIPDQCIIGQSLYAAKYGGLQEKVDRILLEHFPWSREKLEEIYSREKIFSAKELLELGFVHRVFE